MDPRTASAAELGASLTGLGINLLVRDVPREADFLARVFGLEVVRSDRDYALVSHRGHLLQIHADHTYHAHPLPGLLPEAGPRGAGVELRLFGSDPDAAASRAGRHGGSVLQTPADKPHGLRESCILDPEGYCWVPSRPIG